MKLENGKKVKDYCKTLLQACKTWPGPCTSAEELYVVIRKHSEQIFVAKTEMAHSAHTHKTEKV